MEKRYVQEVELNINWLSSKGNMLNELELELLPRLFVEMAEQNCSLKDVAIVTKLSEEILLRELDNCKELVEVKSKTLKLTSKGASSLVLHRLIEWSESSETILCKDLSTGEVIEVEDKKILKKTKEQNIIKFESNESRYDSLIQQHAHQVAWDNYLEVEVLMKNDIVYEMTSS